ncbi:MAG: hypothetical protein CMP81_01515 [Fulvimarina sp.]|nr:hypothetical protein [Fulvimarina sp.]
MSAEILARAAAAANALNDALREAAHANVTLTVAVRTEPLHGQSGPQIDLVEVAHLGHQEGRRPQDLNSANDD